jgi:hypothetical protein
VARAQKAAVPVIGFLDAGSAAARTQQVAAFRKGLAEAGYHEGQNVALEFRWAEGEYGRFGELAADLVRRRVNVIVTPGSGTAALAAKAATSTIPIVFGAGGDPAQEGLVASLSRPGGNATGVNFFTVEVVAKRMELLRELVPTAKRIVVLVNPADPEGYQTLRDLQVARGEQILHREVATGQEIDTAFADMARNYNECCGPPAVLQWLLTVTPLAPFRTTVGDDAAGLCWLSASRSASHDARYRLPKRTMTITGSRHLAAFPFDCSRWSTEMPNVSSGIQKASGDAGGRNTRSHR